MGEYFKEHEHLIRRVVKLPTYGSATYLYTIIGKEEFRFLYRWLPDNTWEKIPLLASVEQEKTYLEEGANIVLYGDGSKEDPYILNSSTDFPEAPANNKFYARRNHTWQEVIHPPSIPEAPDDGRPYVRIMANWEPSIPEAPEDGKPYVRIMANWEPSIPEAPEDSYQYARSDKQWVKVDRGIVDIEEGSNVSIDKTNPSKPIISAIDTKFPEAPEDGFYYGRESLSWKRVVPEAPEDGVSYVRNSGAWVEVDAASFPEAPSDNKFYARRNYAWQEVIHPPSIPEAPDDGVSYARNNGAWVEIDETPFPEAPADNKFYARINYAWQEVIHPPSIPEAPDDGKQYARKDRQWSEVTGISPTLEYKKYCANIYGGEIINHDQGSLVVGDTYIIREVSPGDDFDNTGFVSPMIPFEAEESTPNVWTNRTEVINMTVSKPTVLVLENDTGGTIDWDYTYSAGAYQGYVGKINNMPSVSHETTQVYTGHLTDHGSTYSYYYLDYGEIRGAGRYKGVVDGAAYLISCIEVRVYTS